LSIEIKAEKLAKSFIRRNYIFQDIDFRLSSGEILGITGDNGSGKSTLVKIIAGVSKPTVGELTFSVDGKVLKPEEYYLHYGLVAPYLNIYEEFTPLELMEIICRFRYIEFSEKTALELLVRFNLSDFRNSPIRAFSSGMKQRMKFIIALMHPSKLLLLDEPSSNLDENGTNIVKELIRDFAKGGGAVILATNDEREKALCHNFVSVMNSNIG